MSCGIGNKFNLKFNRKSRFYIAIPMPQMRRKHHSDSDSGVGSSASESEILVVGEWFYEDNIGSLYLQNVSKLTSPNFSIAVATFLLNSSSSILALGNEYLKSIKFMLGKLYEQ